VTITTITAKEVKDRLRKEFEERILAYLPDDETIVECAEVEQERDEEACLLDDVFEIVPKLRHYYPQETIRDIMGNGGEGLKMLLSKWQYRIGILVQHYVK
jgi:hypothetical protein